MAARVVEFCDAVAAAIAADWPDPPPAAVERTYAERVRLDALAGRKVWVFPAGYANPGPATRGRDWNDYTAVVVVAERYAGEGAVPDDWVDGLVEFVEAEVWDRLGDARTVELLGKWPDVGSVTVYDVDLLTSKKVFWSEVEVTFRGVE